MKLVEAITKKEQRKFIDFRRKIYKLNPLYVDNNLFMIKEVFSKKTSFIENKNIIPINIEENEEVVCQGIVIYAKELRKDIFGFNIPTDIVKGLI